MADPHARRTRRPGRLHGFVFILVLCLSITTIHIIWKNTPLASHDVLESIAPNPPSSDYYLSITDENAIDGYVFAHELEKVCEPMRKAEVVFFGNSLVQFAFRGEVLRSFFERQGMNYYLLGFPNGSVALAYRVLERCNAQPRLAIVYETGFLTGRPTAYDELILDSDRFGARKSRMEFEFGFALRRAIHRILPHPVGRDLEGAGWIVYRSVRNGDWWIAGGNERSIPADDDEIRRVLVPAEDLLAAEQFSAHIRKGGGQTVLGYVPTKGSAVQHLGRSRAHAIAAHLDVPILDPKLSGLVTADGIHLTRASADRYARAITSLLGPFLAPLTEAPAILPTL